MRAAIGAAVRRSDGYPVGGINVAVPGVRDAPALRARCIRELLAARQMLERDLPENHSPAPSRAGASRG